MDAEIWHLLAQIYVNFSKATPYIGKEAQIKLNSTIKGFFLSNFESLYAAFKFILNEEDVVKASEI
jgi:hypothetical protein